MLTAHIAFALGYTPATLKAIHAQRVALDELGGDASVGSQPKLAHAVKFGLGVNETDETIARGKVEPVVAAARAAGVKVIALPARADDWPTFDASAEESLGIIGTAATGSAYRVGRRARDLLTAWARAERLAYLRASAPEHAQLAALAAELVADTAAAGTALAGELQRLPAQAARRARIQKWIAAAPPADATTSQTFPGGAFEEIGDWIATLEQLLAGISKDLTPPTTATREDGPMQLTEFLRKATELAASGSISTLKLEGAGGRVAELAQCAALAKVEHLEMRSQHITDADIQALAASPHVSGLRVLSVERNDIGDAGIDALAAATGKALRSLQAVGLDLNTVRDPSDRRESTDESGANEVSMATDEGKALEAKYGPLPWLHPG